MRLYDHVAVVAPGLRLDRRAAMAATARSLGVGTSVDGEIRAARRRFEESASDGSVGTESAVGDGEGPSNSVGPDSQSSRVDLRRRVAETSESLVERRERVATLRGRLRETNEPAVETEYRRAIRELSEAETAHLAARERLEAAERRARRIRDGREDRLRSRDRLDNLERVARRELVDAVRPSVESVLPSVPGSDAVRPDSADPITMALALVRVGTVRPPIALACRRFPNRSTAETWLRTAVLRL